jgi:ParB-like chromosome segregation protein Spo0J
MMTDEELEALSADIESRGQIDAIAVLDGMILDGRNRCRACELAHVKPRTFVVNTDSPTAYVISKNLKRRQLTAVQLAVVANKAHQHFEAEAEARQKAGRSADGEGGGRGKKKPSRQFAGKVSNKGNESINQAAAAVGAGQKATAIMKAVRERAPEVFKAVESGAISTVAEAARAAGLAPTPAPEPRGAGPVSARRKARDVWVPNRGHLRVRPAR